MSTGREEKRREEKRRENTIMKIFRFVF